MGFFTQYNNKIIPTTAGEEETTEYQRVLNEKTKEWTLKPIGKRNIYNEIQEAGIGSSLKEMIIKYQNDEIDTFENRTSSYIDTTTIPENKIEYEEHIKNLEQQINETKNKIKEQEIKAKELYEKARKEELENEKK